MEGTARCRATFRPLEGVQNKKDFYVQVKICVEVYEQVERLVRCTNVMREDGAQNRSQRHATSVVHTDEQSCAGRRVCQI